MIKIKDIAHLQTGIYTKPDRHGNATYLQVKYFDDKGELIEILRSDIFVEARLSRHLLNDGDVLFAAKGEKNFAAVYKSSFGPCVASSSFFIIRRSQDIIPEYLAWYINHPQNMKKLKSEAKGSSIPSISIKTIGNLELKIPAKYTQKTILDIDALRIKEKTLLSEIAMLKDQLVDAKILSRI
jgi:restriction endonuclease S subunit